MVVEWTLNVEGFGKIEDASIRVSPFMIFAGDNNSGKSYIMTLLWGILMIEQFSLDLDDVLTTPQYKNFHEWFKSNLGNEEVVLDQAVIRLAFDLFNQVLDKNKDHFTNELFNATIPIKSISLTDGIGRVPIVLMQLVDNVEYLVANSSTTSKYPIEKFTIKMSCKSDDNSIKHFIFSLCYKIVLGDLSDFIRGGTYLPASRTGFMMTYKALASKAVRVSFHSRGQEATNIGDLTTPVSNFLGDLIRLKIRPKSRFIQVAEFLEDHILLGKIEQDQSPVPNYVFKPKGTDMEMSLHITSSLVSELSPIVAYLKSDEVITTLIIEEPEAHLHLDMQRYIARALVRLVNMGLPVWITTHSDTLVQQINNLIKLNNNSHRKELADQYGYEEIDYLDPENVRVYQFNTLDNKSSVHLQPLTSNGFAFPTFTESIEELTNETIDFMENDADDEEHD